MIRIKTTGRAMPNTTQWTEHSGLKRDKPPPYAIRDFPFFRRVVNAKFHGFCPSESSDERKMRKMTFPPWRKCGNRQNLRFVHGKYRHGKLRKACKPLRLLKTLPVLEKYIRNRLITIACFFVSACY